VSPRTWDRRFESTSLQRRVCEPSVPAKNPRSGVAPFLAADVMAYSRLMGGRRGGDARSAQRRRRQLFDPKIKEHRGRIVKTTGRRHIGGIPSVVDAVRCAVELQRGMGRSQCADPEDERIIFRIGINLGDIIGDGDDIYGDGVNIAARLEALAQPGGVCISRVVRDQIRDKLPYPFEDLGEQNVKNIARPGARLWHECHRRRVHPSLRHKDAAPILRCAQYADNAPSCSWLSSRRSVSGRQVWYGAAGVGAECCREEAGGKVGAATARRAAAEMIAVPRVARRRPRQVEGRATIANSWVGLSKPTDRGDLAPVRVGVSRRRLYLFRGCAARHRLRRPVMRRVPWSIRPAECSRSARMSRRRGSGRGTRRTTVKGSAI